MPLEPDQSFDAISLAETVKLTGFMPGHASRQISSQADIGAPFLPLASMWTRGALSIAPAHMDSRLRGNDKGGGNDEYGQGWVERSDYQGPGLVWCAASTRSQTPQGGGVAVGIVYSAVADDPAKRWRVSLAKSANRPAAMAVRIAPISS